MTTYEEAVERLRGLMSYDRSESRFDAGRLIAHYEDLLGKRATLDLIVSAGASSRQAGRYLTYGRVYRWFPDVDDEGAWERWPDALDRAEELTFGHHEAVWEHLLANADERDIPEAERLLTLAAVNGWGVTRLRDQLAGQRADERSEIVVVVPGELMCRHDAGIAISRIVKGVLQGTAETALEDAHRFAARLTERIQHDHELQRALASLLREV